MAENLQIKYGNFSALPSSDPDAGCIYVCVDTGDVYAAPAGILVHIGTVDFTKLQNKPKINGKEVSGTGSSWNYSIPGAYLTPGDVTSLTPSSSVEDFADVFGSYADLSSALANNYLIVCPAESGYILVNVAYISGTDIVLYLSVPGGDMLISATVSDGEYSNVVVTVTTVLYTSNIVDNLTSSSATSPLSANQGRVLQSTKQDKLVSGTNIRTINGTSLLGSGDIAITTTTLGLTRRSFPINGNTYQIYSNTSGTLPQVFSPTAAGTEGQVLVSSGEGAPVWSDASSVIDLSDYVTSENLATTLSDYVSKTSLTSTLGGYVPTTRTINGKALSGNVTLQPADLSILSRNIPVNGTNYTVYANIATALPTIFAPTSAGSSGQILISSGTGAPTWEDVTEIFDASTFVPATRTINGKALSSNITLVPSDLSIVSRTITINGSGVSVYSSTSASGGSIYAPTTAGTSNQVLASKGSGAPQWVDISDLIDISSYVTNSDLSQALSDYVPNTRTVNGKSLSANVSLVPSDLGILSRNIPINGTNYAVYSNASSVMPAIYAPVAVGSAGQILTSRGSGSPIWSDVSSVIDLSDYVTSSDLTEALTAYVTSSSLSTTLSGYVPTTRTVNGKALSGNISLSAADIGLQGRSLPINGNSYTVYSNLSGAMSAVYGPTTVGSNGQIPMSSGAGAPKWVNPPYVSAAQSGDDIFTASGSISISNFLSGLTSLKFISSTKLSAVATFSSDSTLVLTGFSSFISGLSTVSMEGATIKASMSPDSGDILMEIAAPVPGITVFVYKPASGSLSGWYLSTGTDVSVGTSGASRVYLLGKSTGTSQNLSEATVSVGQGAYLSASGTILNAEDFRRTGDPTYPLNVKSLVGLEDFAISTTPVTCYISSSIAASVSAAGGESASVSTSASTSIKCYPGLPVTMRFNSTSSFTSYFAVRYYRNASSTEVDLYRITKSGSSINVVTNLGAVIPSWYLGPVSGSTTYIPYMLTWYPAQSGYYVITKS